MYIVHMKRVTASEARKNWFRLLDEVAQGEVVCIERGGRRILLQRQPEEGDPPRPPDYASLLSVPEVEQAHRWGWTWSEEKGDLEIVEEAGELRAREAAEAQEANRSPDSGGSGG